MNHLFWGLFFVLLDYKVSIGSAAVEVLPDFAGYYLLMKGMELHAQQSVQFDRSRHWAFGMAVFSGLLFGAELLGPDGMGRVWLWAAELAALAAMLVLLRRLLRGFRELGKNTERPDAMWLILAAMLPICHLVSWVPVVGSVCGVASLTVAALFLLSVYAICK